MSRTFKVNMAEAQFRNEARKYGEYMYLKHAYGEAGNEDASREYKLLMDGMQSLIRHLGRYQHNRFWRIAADTCNALDEEGKRGVTP